MGRGKPFGKDNPPPGRKGIPNKVTGALREAVIEAAGLIGSDGLGKDGLAGYLFALGTGAVQERVSFAGLLGRCLPKQIDATIEGGNVRIVVETTAPTEPKA